jgi:hypothetical protein
MLMPGWRHARQAGQAAVLGLVCGVFGCGGQGDVAGKVTFRGQPVTAGTVRVQGPDNLIHDGAIQADGSYAVSAVPVGPARLLVHVVDPELEKFMQAVGKRHLGQTGASPPRPPNPAKRSRVPARYDDFDTSGLRLEVKPGTNPYDIALK